MKSRSIWIRLGSAIGVAVLLPFASPMLAIAEPSPAEEPSAPEPTAGEPATDGSALAAGASAAATEAGEPARETSAPTRVVDELHENLINVMKEATTLGYQGRFARLEPVIHELFDIPFMAEKSIGRHWKTVDEHSRADLLATFERFTVANYAGRFTGYSGQSFETLSEQASKHGTVLVYSRLVSGNGETVQLNYRLRPAGEDGWRIIDVLLNGTVSELALRRSEYSSLIQREGFPALMSALNQRIDELADGEVNDKAS